MKRCTKSLESVSKRVKKHLSRYDNWLWQATRFFLRDFADFEDGRNAFVLKRNPFPEEKIYPGPYCTGRNVENANLYRLGHPLAQRILEACKSIPTETTRVFFDYTRSSKTITPLKELVELGRGKHSR